MARQTRRCTACGERRPHAARGWCNPCYRRWDYHGRPDSGPPPVARLTHDDVAGTVRGWDWHMRTGVPACAGCRAAHADRMREQYRTKGAPRPVRLARHYTESATAESWTGPQEQAARLVAASAAGADDCRVLLQALGLVPGEVADTSRIGGAA